MITRTVYLIFGAALGFLLTVLLLNGRLEALRSACGEAVYLSLKRGCIEGRAYLDRPTCDQITDRAYQDFRDITQIERK